MYKTGKQYYFSISTTLFVLLLCEMFLYQEVVRKLTWIAIIILIVVNCAKQHFTFKISVYEIWYYLIILGTQIVAMVYSNVVKETNDFNLHVTLIFILNIFLFYSMPRRLILGQDVFEKTCKVMLVCIAMLCVINYIKNFKILIAGNFLYHSANRSLLRSLSTYAWVLTLGIIFCLYFIAIDIKKACRYLVLLALFEMSVFLTGSRTAIVVSVVSILAICCFSDKLKKYLKFLVPIILAIIVVYCLIKGDTFLKLKNLLYNIATHNGTEEFLKSQGRESTSKMMWETITLFTFLFGNGFGSVANFLHSIGISYGSFHSMYNDIFYSGGIILIILYLVPIAKVLKKVKFSKLDKEVKAVYYTLLVNVLVNGIKDSYMMFFESNIYSLVANFLIITMPIMMTNRLKENEIENMRSQK